MILLLTFAGQPEPAAVEFIKHAPAWIKLSPWSFLVVTYDGATEWRDWLVDELPNPASVIAVPIKRGWAMRGFPSVARWLKAHKNYF